MKKLLFLGLFFILIFQTPVFADVKFFNEDGKFGAKDEQGNIVVKPKYNKLIRLGDKTLLAQKKNKFGIIDFFIYYKYTNPFTNKFIIHFLSIRIH